MGASHRASLLLRRRRSDPRPRSRAQSSGLPHPSHRCQQISQINGVAVPPNPVTAFYSGHANQCERRCCRQYRRVQYSDGNRGDAASVFGNWRRYFSELQSVGGGKCGIHDCDLHGHVSVLGDDYVGAGDWVGGWSFGRRKYLGLVRDGRLVICGTWTFISEEGTAFAD